MNFSGFQDFYSTSDSDVEAFLQDVEEKWPEIVRRIPETQLVSFLDKFDHIGALVTPVTQSVPEVLERAGYEGVSFFPSRVIARELGSPTRCFKGSKMLSGRQLTVELFQPETEAGRICALNHGRYGAGTGEGVHFAFRIDDSAGRAAAMRELESIGYFFRLGGVNRHEQQTVRFFDGPYGRIEIVSTGVDNP